MDYKKELEKMYSEIYFCNGKCKCFLECSKNMPNNKEINCCKLKLGENYGNNIPKIMFVGKEGVNPATEIETPEKVSKVLYNNSHYFGTILTLAYMLKKIDDKGLVKENKNQKFLSQFDYLCSNMCLTNYYKCAYIDEKRHGVKVNKTMKQNCPIILSREIEILKPNIIIIQGKFTTKLFYEIELLKIVRPIPNNPVYNSTNTYKISVDKYEYIDSNEPLYIVWSYHPSSHGHWDNSINELKSAINEIKI